MKKASLQSQAVGNLVGSVGSNLFWVREKKKDKRKKGKKIKTKTEFGAVGINRSGADCIQHVCGNKQQCY